MRRWGVVLLVVLLVVVNVWALWSDCSKQLAYRCKNLSISTTEDRRTFQILTVVEAIGATPLSAEYDFGDGAREEVVWPKPDGRGHHSNETVVRRHTYASPQWYSVHVSVTFAVDGQRRIANSPACQKTVKVA